MNKCVNASMNYFFSSFSGFFNVFGLWLRPENEKSGTIVVATKSWYKKKTVDRLDASYRPISFLSNIS